MDVLRIGELSTLTGVSRSTLRMWERRYGVVVPERLENGYRVYSPEDIERVLTMRRALSRGVGAAEAAAAARAARDGGAEPSAYTAVAALAEIRSAFDAWDAARGSRAVQRAIVTLGVGVAVADVLFPYLREVGERWARGEITVAQEHFASQAVRGVLVRLAAGWEEAPGPTALLACPPGEEHDIGLVCFGLVLRGFHGWRIVFLGGSTPLADVFKAAHALSPRAIVLSAVASDRFRDGRPSLTRLAARFRLALAGAGATPRLAGAVGAELLPGDPVAAAALLVAPRGA